MFELNSKCVVVTGAARGLGQAIAIKFAEAGANMWLYVIYTRIGCLKL